MAAEEAASSSYWQTTVIKYADGHQITVKLDSPTIARIQAGDHQLIEEIRKNYSKTQTDSEVIDDTIQEEKTESGPTFWTDDATKMLITLYQQIESELENPQTKKKDVWEMITNKLNDAGYNFTRNKVECKWRNLLASHKDIKENKKTTGEKRKSFKYFQSIEDIVGKRHDINPPFKSGTSVQKTQRTSFQTKVSATPKNTCPASKSDSDESFEISDSTPNKGKKRKRQSQTARDDQDVLDFLKDMEATRLKNYEESERRKDARAKERNEILKDFLKALKD